MLSDLSLVIELQGLDSRIAELEREISTLPKHIAQIEKTLESHQRRLQADEAALSANAKERKGLDLEIQTQDQKRSKLRDQMMGAKTNEQYKAFQHEIDFCGTAIRKCEDRIIELMEESEPLEQNVRKAKAALDQEKKQVEEEKSRARERTAVDEKQLSEARQAREKIVAAVTPDVYAIYAKQCKKKYALAVADATDGRCASCQMVLRPQFFQDLKLAERVLRCESCGAILFYNPPVAFDSGMTAPVPDQQVV